MIEAWEIEHRRVQYFFLRRFEMIRYLLGRAPDGSPTKAWHADASWWARLRAIALVLGGHEGEICNHCGRKMEAVWWCPSNLLWAELTGWREGGGCACMRCFDRLAEEKGIFFIWQPMIEGTEKRDK